MNRITRGLVRVCLVVLCSAVALAQSNPPVAIVLPHKVVAEQAASLAVLDAAGALVAGAKVEFEGGESVTTDATGRATFVAPALPANARSGILKVGLAGLQAKESSTVLPAMPAPSAPVIADLPPIVSAQDRFTVTGTGLRGDVDAVRAWLGDEPAIVLAASPLAVVVLARAGMAPGPTQLILEVNGQKLAPVPVTLATLSITSAKGTLAPGARGKVRVQVNGTTQRLEIELRNLSPQIVALGAEDVVRAYTKGGAENFVEAELVGKSEGEYSLSARLMPLPAGLPNVEASRQKLMAARRMAQGAWGRRLDEVIGLSEQQPEMTQKIREELEKLLAANPPVDLGKLIEEAWLILIKK